MRKDMFKVIVERPRGGGGWSVDRPFSVDEDSPAHESLRARHVHRKHLNENLRPLERYLASQVGQPWDRVYSAICARIDRRSTVQAHIHLHLHDYVAVQVLWLDGQWQAPSRWGGFRPLDDAWAARFYVDADTGRLRVNALRVSARRRWRQERAEARLPPPGRHELSPYRQLHRRDGIWFEVELDFVPGSTSPDGVFDVWLRAPVIWPVRTGQPSRGALAAKDAYGQFGVYARSKRQLSHRELRRHGLANDAH